MRNQYLIWLGGSLIAALGLTTSYAQTNLPKLDPQVFVTWEYRHLSDTIKRFSEADLPVFLEIIADAKRPYREYYPALLAIGHISGKGDEKVVNALVDFLKGPVNWEKWVTNGVSAANVLQAKREALTAMGIIGGDKAEAILKRAMTVAGAEEFTKAWIGGWPQNSPVGSRDEQVGTIRGGAAEALARIEKCEDFVRAEYAKERQACMNAGKKSEYMSGLTTGMSMIDSRKEVGKGKVVPSEIFFKYMRKYQLTTATNKLS